MLDLGLQQGIAASLVAPAERGGRHGGCYRLSRMGRGQRMSQNEQLAWVPGTDGQSYSAWRGRRCVGSVERLAGGAWRLTVNLPTGTRTGTAVYTFRTQQSLCPSLEVAWHRAWALLNAEPTTVTDAEHEAARWLLSDVNLLV